MSALLIALAGCSRPAHPPGAILYRQYCASCHGLSGTGDGPVAGTLRVATPDLTQLARRSGGFDEAAVMAMIDGRRQIAAHGTREMPVWGVVFEQELKDRAYTGYTGILRAKILSDYLRTIQKK